MKILGIMSGSSLDGMDFALCEFLENDTGVSWSIIKADTIEYSAEWVNRIRELPDSSARDIALADYNLGYLFGEKSKYFLDGEEIDYISSHGHTIFHEPQNKMTFQIGNGAAIATASGISTMCDFRSIDIGHGGQGAPIVAILDRDLLPEYSALVNLGGIANISFTNSKDPIAYDISPCNQLLNFLARKAGKEYDKDGNLASLGTVNNNLLNQLLSFDYFKESYPKSLDNNYIKNNFIPILENSVLSIEDKMATSVELIATTMANEFEKYFKKTTIKHKVLFAGGGTNNIFLMQRIKAISKKISIIIPDKTIIDYKEALLMAYLGYLRVKEYNNVLSSVTGAGRDSIGGAMYIIK